MYLYIYIYIFIYSYIHLYIYISIHTYIRIPEMFQALWRLRIPPAILENINNLYANSLFC